MENHAEEPVLLALIFADQVIVEAKTNKQSIIGSFTQFYADKFPATFPPWCIYVSITNIVGEHSFSLNLLYEKEAYVSFSGGGKFKVPSRSIVHDFILPIKGAVFPGEGVYNFTFNLNGKQVGARVLKVIPMQQRKN